MQLPELLKVLAEEYPLAEDQKSLRYTDEYELLEAEIQKLTSVYGEKPNAEVILDQGVLLLKQGSAHPYVITALAYAMLQQYAWPGFLEGIHFVSRRLEGGDQFAHWLVERYQHYLKLHPVGGLGKDFIEKMLLTLKGWKLEAVITLIRPFEDQQKRMKQEEGVRAANQRLEEERKAEQLQKLQEVLVHNTEVETIQIDEHLELLKQNPLEFAIYKYRRAQMWWRYPLSSQELVGLIDEQGLEWSAYSAALKLKLQQNNEEALIAFEMLAHAHPYFLELQFQVCTCLEDLQAEESLLAMLKNEVRELCVHYPELESAKINNKFAVLSKQSKIYFDIFLNN